MRDVWPEESAGTWTASLDVTGTARDFDLSQILRTVNTLVRRDEFPQWPVTIA